QHHQWFLHQWHRLLRNRTLLLRQPLSHQIPRQTDRRHHQGNDGIRSQRRGSNHRLGSDPGGLILECGDLSPLSPSRLVSPRAKAPTSRSPPKSSQVTPLTVTSERTTLPPLLDRSAGRCSAVVCGSRAALANMKTMTQPMAVSFLSISLLLSF